MDYLTDEELDALAGHSGEHSVSIWMPAHRAGPEVREDRLRMKNLVARAEDQLAAAGQRAADARDRLHELRRLAEDEGFWRERADGLAAFLGDGPPRVLRLPVTAPELVTVGGRFHVKPLFGAPRQDRAFHLLALSEDRVRFFRASRFVIERVELPDAPESFEQFLRFDDFEKHVEYHTGTAGHGPGGERPAVYHGQGEYVDEAEQKKRLMGYCGLIDREVVKAMHNRSGPLMLAATEPLAGLYRRVSACDRLDDRVVGGNPDRAHAEDLHRQAVALLGEDFERPVRELASRYHQAKDKDMAADDLAEILRAASLQAVDSLLVAADEQQWGRFDADKPAVERHDGQQPGDEDLLNAAAVLAHRGGARVYAVRREDVPNGGLAAAVLRFRPDG